MTGPALALIAEARRLGITLRADADTIHYRPKDRMPPDLAERIKAHKLEVLRALRLLDPGGSAPDRTGCPQTKANGRHGVQGGAKRPARFSAPRQSRPTTPADDPADAGLPVRWRLDATDRAILLECGILPTPAVDDLPPAWQADYTRLVKLMIGRGLHREKAAKQGWARKDKIRIGEIEVRATARLGELLKKTEKAKGTRGLGRPKIGGAVREPPKDENPTLASLGVTKKQNHVAQQVAGRPTGRAKTPYAKNAATIGGYGACGWSYTTELTSCREWRILVLKVDYARPDR